MIALVMAAAAGASAPSVIAGAFGFVINQAPPPAIANCEEPNPDGGERMFVCAGDDFFNQVYVHTGRGLVTSISAVRNYRQEEKAAAQACRQDLLSLVKVIERRYPTLNQVEAHQPLTFERTDRIRFGTSWGRRIGIRCEETIARGPSQGKASALWITYSHSIDEGSAIRDLDETERLRADGLDPSKL